MAHIQVALDLGGSFAEGLTYSAGDHPLPRAGALVTVPVRNRASFGVSLGEVPEPDFPTRPIHSVASALTLTPEQVQLSRWIARHYRAPLFDALRLWFPPGLEKRAANDLATLELWPTAARFDPPPLPEQRPTLSRDQDEARREIVRALGAPHATVLLLHGVTGSGKTHVFLEAADEALRRGQQVIMLVSDISLTPEAVQRVERRFPGRVAVLHSQISDAQRARTWRAVYDGACSIVIGARSALFAPARKLGLIVVDEEHEPSYKQDVMPRYDARDVAVQLSRLSGAPLVLSSATPDVCTYHLAEQGIYRLLTLPHRIAGVQGGRAQRAELPEVEVVDLKQELRAGHSGLLSRSLEQQMSSTLAAGLQVMLFLNRRGAATALSCRGCGQAVDCRRCNVPLGFHPATELLICHRCGRKRDVPAECPRCGEERLLPVGAGVQQVESETRRKFPSATIMRWDRDTTATRGSHERLWRAFSQHEADILVGTQMIGKGLDFPDVGLVGIVLAESQLFLPDFRAAERTFQILTQVAGRAGRRSSPRGRVVLQTFTPDHYAIRAAAHHDYLDLYRRELAFRRQQAYPPFRPLIRLVHSASNEQSAESTALDMGRRFAESVQRLGLADVQIIGPAPSFIARLRGRYRWHIILAGADASRLLDEHPLNRSWTIDVDPRDTL